MNTHILIGFMAALISSSQLAVAQTVTVTTAADIVDINSQTGTIASLPGPDGEVSLSEALIATNNTPGHQTIAFAVPNQGWLLQFLFPGRVVFTSITGYYWRANDEVTIDGTTQTAFTGNTNPNGGEVVIYGDPLYFNAPNSTLIGFDSSSVFFGSDSLIQGNTGNMNITVSGSRTRVEGNSGGTIKISGNDNVVVGNTVLRVRVQSGNNNIIGGPNPEDRNFITGYGNWNFSSGLPSGTTLQVVGTVGTVIENNYIGTTPDGLAQGNPASTLGVSFEGSNHDIVVRDNLIAGINAVGIGTWAGVHFGYGVLFWGSGSNIELTGNTIGLDANGHPLLGSVWGINVGNVSGAGVYTNIRIGGAGLGQGNTVAGHTLNGITVGLKIPDARISENSIYGNGALGIDLVSTGLSIGVTPNDPLDLDTGANGLQNFPELASATLVGGNVRIQGSLQSTPLDDFTIEFFASADCDPSGFGEAEVFLGALSVTTDAGGDAAIDALLAASVPVGWFVTATATLEPLGATSELSACRVLTAQGTVTYCSAKTGLACGTPAIGFSGTPSASATSGFVIDAQPARSNRVGIFIYTDQGPGNASFQGGTLCLTAPIRRSVPVNSGGTASCDGVFAIDWNAFAQGLLGGNPQAFLLQPGQRVNLQTWGRDSIATGTLLSDALEYHVLQ